MPVAWHKVVAYSSLADRLGAAGYKVINVDLPANDTEPALQSWDPDVEATRTVILAAVERDEEVVVVAHSHGGAVDFEAIIGLTKADRIKEGPLGGGVIHHCIGLGCWPFTIRNQSRKRGSRLALARRKHQESPVLACLYGDRPINWWIFT